MFTRLVMVLLVVFFAVHSASAKGILRKYPAQNRRQESWLRTTVRVYGTAGSGGVTDADSEVLVSALPETGRILSAAGVELNVLECAGWHSDNESDPCARSPQSREFLVRTYRSAAFPPGTAGDHRLAYSLLDSNTGQGSLVTIDLSAIEWLAVESGADPQLLLGRTLAHEVGHLLLGSSGHAKSGLMRTVWSAKELQRNRAQDWTFTSRQVAAIHEERHTQRASVQSAALLAHASH